MKEALFWADKKARAILERKKFHYLDKEIPKFERYTIKTSASISGVLHIGRLSDTIRADSVCTALRDLGQPSELIWVAEDMDPLRKVPEGVPKSYREYIGMSVVDVPDPWGCHSSFAEHHTSKYMEVLEKFTSTKPKIYSMSEEYRRGRFRPYIKTMLERLEAVMGIQNKYREEPLHPGWSPFTPVCENCGKIITAKAKDFKERKVIYKCEDYPFETEVAVGCGHEGESDPLKDRGKLMWKGEWAAQWARWKVVSEGAGKEYIVPSSAWWINAEIVEKVLDFPMPVPVFYEHLMIDGKKMSASLGNVVYPSEWLEVAPPQLLRFFYNKKLMKTRSFSWRDLPTVYDDYDYHAKIYSGEEKIENEKEERHMKRLYQISQLGEIEGPISLPFSHAVAISQIFKEEEALVASLMRSGHYRKEAHDSIIQRIRLAGNWVNKYAPEEMKVNLEIDVEATKSKLSKNQKAFLKSLANWLKEKDRTADEIHNEIYSLGKELDLPPKEAFQALYLSVLGVPRGPRAGALIASLDKGWTVRRLDEVSG